MAAPKLQWFLIKWSLLVAMFVGAPLVYVLTEPLISDDIFKRYAEHLSMALSIAGILGILFEAARDIRTEDRFSEIKEATTVEIRKMFASFSESTTREVFGLIREMAEQQASYPTLYFPVRSNAERTLKDATYFQKMIPAGRQVLVDHLSEWIQESSHSNLKFLASDIIGMHKIHELRSSLLEIADRQFDLWHCKSAEDKGWILNYVWAASTCDNELFKTLSDRLLSTEWEDVHEWILFVPQQMQHVNLINMISRYLDKHRNVVISEKCVDACIAGLGRHATKFDVRPVFKLHKRIFEKQRYQAKIHDCWKGLGLDSEPILKTIRPKVTRASRNSTSDQKFPYPDRGVLPPDTSLSLEEGAK